MFSGLLVTFSFLKEQFYCIFQFCFKYLLVKYAVLSVLKILLSPCLAWITNVFFNTVENTWRPDLILQKLCVTERVRRPLRQCIPGWRTEKTSAILKLKLFWIFSSLLGCLHLISQLHIAQGCHLATVLQSGWDDVDQTIGAWGYIYVAGAALATVCVHTGRCNFIQNSFFPC